SSAIVLRFDSAGAARQHREEPLRRGERWRARERPYSQHHITSDPRGCENHRNGVPTICRIAHSRGLADWKPGRPGGLELLRRAPHDEFETYRRHNTPTAHPRHVAMS